MSLIVRTYSPPTCTLKVFAKNSSLSRWTHVNLIRNLKFELRFDDPRISEAQKVIIQGDHTQLELLDEVITQYTQNFLQNTSNNLQLTVSNSANLFPVTETENSELKEQQKTSGFFAKPSLKPKSLIAHELFFGSLATATSGKKINLSTLQLFDLANALDECKAELTTLPELEPQVVPYWMTTAAAIVLAIGLTTAVWKLHKPQNQVIASNKQAASRLIQPNPIGVVPPFPPNDFQSSLPPIAVPNPLINSKTLPPPSSVELPKTTSQIPAASQKIQVPTNKTPNSAEKSTITVIPKTEATTTSSNPSLKKTEKISLNNNQLPPPTINNSISKNNSAIETQPPASNRLIIAREDPTLPNLPPLQSIPSTSEATIAELTKPDSLPASIAPKKSPLSIATGNTQTSPNSNTMSQDQLAITSPQITEVKQYFQQNWKPPQGLTQTLEYRLQLNNNGSISRIIPVGKSSEIYVDQTNLPLINEPFVSPIQSGENLNIRVVLSPDGTVKTFKD